MRVLMLAPQPFFEPRGAPFSVYHRARALGKLGHAVDLVAYPIGQDITIPKVTLRRAWRLPLITRVKVGPSLAKIPLDVTLFVRALTLVARNRYDCVFTNQEAGVFGAIISTVFRIPHVYDMHADIAEELVNFKFTANPLLVRAMRGVLELSVRSARVVIAAYPELIATIQGIAPDKPVVMIENIAVEAEDAEVDSAMLHRDAVQRLRREFNVPDGRGPVLVYTGTFEHYQGIDALVESVPGVLAQFPNATYILVGGHPEQVAHVRDLAERLGVAHAIRLPGRRPTEEMAAFMQLADILLSPRAEGTNTPLKLYSYLHAGKPILATNIRSNTQVLSSQTALLVEPSSDSLTAGTKQLLADAEVRQQLACNAKAVATQKYSYRSFLELTSEVCDHISAK